MCEIKDKIDNFNRDVNGTKVTLWTCDRCHKTNTLCAYNPKFGWYCEECLVSIRDGLNEKIASIEEYKALVSQLLEKHKGEQNE